MTAPADVLDRLVDAEAEYTRPRFSGPDHRLNRRSRRAKSRRCEGGSTTSRGTRGKCFVFLNNRHYNPTTGTFLSVDPLVTLTMQPYIYGAANPIRYSDPSGLEPCRKDDCKSDDSGGRLPCGRSTYNTSGCKLGNGPKGSDGLPTTVFGPNDPHNRAITESRERKRNHSQDVWERYDQEGRDFANLVGGFLPYVGESIDANDCRRGRKLGCVALGLPFVGSRFLGNIFGGAARGGDNLAVDAIGTCFRSFSADTEVLMADGTTKPISQIVVGDVLLAEDPETGERGPRTVTRLWVHEDELIDLVTDAGSISTTEDHPFWNDSDREWQAASEVDAGDSLLASDGSTVVAEKFDRTTSRTGLAFNLSLSEIHTYFVEVGETEVLVHNTCSFSLSSERLTHVTNRHTVNGVDRNGASYFLDEASIPRLINDASEWTPFVQSNNRFAVVVDAGSHVGWDVGTGSQTSLYTVIVDFGGAVRTVHPGLPR